MARRRSPGPDDPRVAAGIGIFRRVAGALRALEVAFAGGRISGGTFLRRVDTQLTRAEVLLQVWVGRPLGSLVAQGASVAGLTTPVARAGVSAAMAALERDTYSDLALATTYLREDSKRVIRAVARAVEGRHLAEGLSVPQARRLVAVELQTKGFIREVRRDFATNRVLEDLGARAPGMRFRDRRGRRWRLDAYAEMVVRTKSAQAYNTGSLVSLQAIGETECRVFDGTQDEICAAVAGKIVPISWALANPVGHPNCTRAFGRAV